MTRFIPPFGSVFVAHKDDTFQCESCAREDGVDLGADETQTWEVGGDGWLAPVVCRTCHLSIPVVVNGTRSSDDLLTRLLDAAEKHGAESDPDHEVGDLRTLVEACWKRLDEADRRDIYAEHESEDS